MKYSSILFFVLIILASSCLKKVDGNVIHDSIFDPLSEPQIWFEQSSIDSAHVGGAVYRYTLTYEIIHPELLDPNSIYSIGVKRNDSSIYGSTVISGKYFRFTMFAQHKVGGNFCSDLGIKGNGTSWVTASFYDCFDY
ncbi:MAG: hypothetical protein GQ574_03830 [Crocinitomix sp.]|nr:hypothetical protein [Crocinitomix sp.]